MTRFFRKLSESRDLPRLDKLGPYEREFESQFEDQLDNHDGLGFHLPEETTPPRSKNRGGHKPISRNRESQTIRIGDVHATFSHPVPNQYTNDEVHEMGFVRDRDRARPPMDEEKWSERQSPLNFLILTGCAILAGIAGWYTYHWITKNGTQATPVILADETPYKVRPDNPGGIVIPHQDKLVYGRIMPEQSAPVEHLLPQPEQPIAPPVPNETMYPQGNGSPYPQNAYPQQPYQGGQVPTEQQGMTYPQQPYPQNAYPQQPQYSERAMPSGMGHQQYPNQPSYAPAPQQSGAYSQPNFPEQYQNNTQSSQGTGYATQLQPTYQPQQPPYPGKPDYTPPASSYRQNQPMQQQPRANPNIPTQAEPMIYPEPIVQSEPPQKTAPVPKSDLDNLIEEELYGRPPAKANHPTGWEQAQAPENPQEGTSDSFRLQVATVPNEEVARREIDRLRKLDPSLFGGRKFIIQKPPAINGKKSGYKVMIGFFPSANAASQFKSKLKIHRIDGIIVKNKSEKKKVR